MKPTAEGVPARNLVPEEARQLRSKILDFLLSRGLTGATCEEVEDALGLSHQTASARISELSKHPVHGGRIVRQYTRDNTTGVTRWVKRKTRSGRSAYVWIINQETDSP
jgi:predicted transcriptional regulator